jgi:hypothetical protein
MQLPQTPLFVKTHDFLLWLLQHTQRFPKNLRHSFTLKLEQTGLDFQESLLMANAVRGPTRGEFLGRADGQLLCLRALFTMAGDLSLLGARQIQYASERLEELGRLLGAWRQGTG